MVGETLEEMRFVGTDAEMMELDLGLRPRQGDRAFEGRRVVVLVGQVERFAARRRDQRPERYAHRGARRNPHAAAKTEDRIEHGTDRVGERPAVHHGDRRPDLAPAAEKTRPIGLELHVAHALAFHNGEVRRPDLRLAGRPPPPRGQKGADIGDELRLHEQLGEGRVRRVGCGRRQHDLGVRGQLDLPGTASEVRNRHAANLGIVLGRDRHFECCRDRPVAPDDFGSILGERHLVAVRLDAARLVSRRPHFAAAHVAQEDVRAPGIAGHVLPPARDREVPPATVSRARSGDHHGVPAVREQVRAGNRVVRGMEPAQHRRNELADVGGRRSPPRLGGGQPRRRAGFVPAARAPSLG